MECPYLIYNQEKIPTIINGKQVFCMLKDGKLVQECKHNGIIDEISFCYDEYKYETNCNYYKINILKDVTIKLLNLFPKKFEDFLKLTDYDLGTLNDLVSEFITLLNTYDIEHKIETLYDCKRFVNTMQIALELKIFPEILGVTISNFNCKYCPYEIYNEKSNKYTCFLDKKLKIKGDIFITKTHTRISNCPLYKNTQEAKKCQQ